MFGRIACFSLLSVLGVSAAGAQEVSGDARIAYASKYVWRGLVIDNDSVLQPSFNLSAHGFTFGFWGNVELTGWNDANYERPGSGRFREVDLTLEYARDAWWVGVGDYHFPGTGWERWQEVYGGYGWETVGSPWVGVAWGDKSGTSVTFGFSHSFMGGERSIDADLEVSWSDGLAGAFLFGHEGSGFTDAMLSVGTTIEAGRGWTVEPRIHASTLLNSRILEGEPRRSNLWVSLGLRYSF